MKRILAAALLAATPAMADPLGLNDYPALFASHADKVRTHESGARSLKIPPGIEIIEFHLQGKIRYTGASYGKSAVGCLAIMYAELTALRSHCPDSMTAVQADVLDLATLKTLTFYAANSLPPASLEEAQSRFNGLVELFMVNADHCPAPDNPALARFVKSVLRKDIPEKPDETFSQPYLPVERPCNYGPDL